MGAGEEGGVEEGAVEEGAGGMAWLGAVSAIVAGVGARGTDVGVCSGLHPAVKKTLMHTACPNQRID